MNKVCSKCEKSKDISKFYTQNKKPDKLQVYCKICSNLRRRQYYLDNMEKEKAVRKVREQKITDWIKNYKEENGCCICGESRWWVLDFHHRKDKEFQIGGWSTRRRSLKNMQKEIAKCNVLCSNCHRDLHHKERQVSSSS